MLRLVWPPIYLMTLVFALTRWVEVRRVLLDNWPLVLLVGICCLSTAWSIDPGVSLRRAVGVAMTTLLAANIVTRFDLTDRLRLFGTAFAIIALCSVLFAVALPTYGIAEEPHAGAWQGVFPQKNALGESMTFGATVFLLLAFVDATHRRRAIAGFLLCAALVVLSTSVTALIALLMVISAATAITFLFRYRALAVVVVYVSIVGSIGLTIVLVTDADAIFRLVGRDASLTGRTDIWEPLWRMMQDRLWLGYGYSAFWVDPDGPAWHVRRILQWNVPSAHNGWAELWLDIGFIGVAIFFVSFVIAASRAVARMKMGGKDESLWPFLFLALFLLFSFSESSIMRHNDIVWIMYVVTVSSLTVRTVRPMPAAYYAGMGEAAPAQWSYWR